MGDWGALGKRADVVYQDDAVILICARWQDVVGDLPTVDAVIEDCPYGELVHSGHDRIVSPGGGLDCERRELSYGHWSEADVVEHTRGLSSVCRGWWFSLTSHDLAPVWQKAYAAIGRRAFAPIPCVINAMTVRLTGDGPSSWAVWGMASRTKAQAKWGTLRGAYVGNREAQAHIGGKPVWLMRAIVGDYSRPADIVLDPCAGGGTTGVAARLEGRRAILIEMDPATAELAAKRLHPLRGKLGIDNQTELFT